MEVSATTGRGIPPAPPAPPGREIRGVEGGTEVKGPNLEHEAALRHSAD